MTQKFNPKEYQKKRSEKYTMLPLSKEVREALREMKTRDRETYDEIIRKMINRENMKRKVEK